MSLVSGRRTDGVQDVDAPFWILRHHSPSPITALAFCGGVYAIPLPPVGDQDDGEEEDDGDEDEDEDEDDDDDDDGDGTSTASSSSSTSIPSRLPEGSRYLIIGDGNGKASLVDLTSYRPLCHWQAHKVSTSILGVQQWSEVFHQRRGGKKRTETRIITHGRDNTLKVWSLQLPSGGISSTRTRQTSLVQPTLLTTLQVNALNFCRFSLLPKLTINHKGKQREERWATAEGEALLAVPHTTDSGYVDIYHLPTQSRLHTSIGSIDGSSRKVEGVTRAPIVMAMHLFRLHLDTLALLVGYEDGVVLLWIHNSSANNEMNGGRGGKWVQSWKQKLHRESVLTLAILQPNEDGGARGTDAGIYFLSAGVDDRIVLGFIRISATSSCPVVHILHTYQAPNARGGRATSVFLPPRRRKRSEAAQGGKQQEIHFAIGGWDGRARIYSYSRSSTSRIDSTTPTSQLGGKAQDEENGTIQCVRTLRYHKETIQAVASAPLFTGDGDQDDAEDLGSLIVLGGKEGRVTLWRA